MVTDGERRAHHWLQILLLLGSETSPHRPMISMLGTQAGAFKKTGMSEGNKISGMTP